MAPPSLTQRLGHALRARVEVCKGVPIDADRHAQCVIESRSALRRSPPSSITGIGRHPFDRGQTLRALRAAQVREALRIRRYWTHCAEASRAPLGQEFLSQSSVRFRCALSQSILRFRRTTTESWTNRHIFRIIGRLAVQLGLEWEYLGCRKLECQAHAPGGVLWPPGHSQLLPFPRTHWGQHRTHHPASRLKAPASQVWCSRGSNKERARCQRMSRTFLHLLVTHPESTGPSPDACVLPLIASRVVAELPPTARTSEVIFVCGALASRCAGTTRSLASGRRSGPGGSGRVLPGHALRV